MYVAASGLIGPKIWSATSVRPLALITAMLPPPVLTTSETVSGGASAGRRIGCGSRLPTANRAARVGEPVLGLASPLAE